MFARRGTVLRRVGTAGRRVNISFKKKSHYLKVQKLINQSKINPVWFDHDDIGFNYRLNNLNASIGSGYEIRRVENVGPKVSAELLKGGLIAIAVSLGAMLFYIWIRFEWQFSIGAILALFHDVLITMGIFSLIGLEVNLSIVAALITIVGYSMNDTVVIFDRVRENLKKHIDLKIFDLTNLSINETLSRTIITSVTTLLALLSIFLFGGEILKGFSLAMILGVVFGTYSSIYIANTVLVRLRVSQKTVLKEEEDKK